MTAPTIAQAALRGRDNFGWLRLALALAVMVSHGYSVPTGMIAAEPLHRLTGYTLGEHAVNGFFAVSGFLVAMSYDRRSDPRAFAMARLLRVVPGLVVATLVTMLVIGGAMTTLPLTAYLADPRVWDVIVVTLTTMKSATRLPGVFEGNPLPFPLATVWTLRYELLCYAGLLVMAVAGGLRHRWVAPAVVAACALALLVLGLLDILPKGRETALRLPMIFTAGVAAHVWRDRLPLSLAALAGAIAVVALAHGTPAYRPLLFAVTGYGVLVLAYHPSLVVPRAPGADLSYGVYLYGWPVQQTLHALAPTVDATLMLVPAIAVTLLAAALSWFGVERPALSLKPLGSSSGSPLTRG